MFEFCDIESIEEIGEIEMVDISVKDDESFVLSNGLISHNSATGGFNIVRDATIHSLLPIKGKTLNVSNESLATVFKNDKYKWIISAIQLGTPNQLRHGKVYIATDQDCDGLHIRILLIQFFAKFFPWFIEEGRLFIIEAPLYRYELNGKKIYTKDEPPKNAKNVKYYKGLGSMDKMANREMLNNPILIPIINVEEITKFYKEIYG